MTKQKMCVNEILVYDSARNEFSMKYPEHNPTRYLSGCKYYASFVLGDTFYFHGGMDTNDRILDEFVGVNLETYGWHEVNLQELGTKIATTTPRFSNKDKASPE